LTFQAVLLQNETIQAMRISDDKGIHWSPGHTDGTTTRRAEGGEVFWSLESAYDLRETAQHSVQHFIWKMYMTDDNDLSNFSRPNCRPRVRHWRSTMLWMKWGVPCHQQLAKVALGGQQRWVLWRQCQKSPYFDNVRELPLLGALWQYNVYVGLGVPKTISSDDPFSRLDAIRNVIMWRTNKQTRIDVVINIIIEQRLHHHCMQCAAW